MLAEFGPEFVVNASGVQGLALGEFEGGFFARAEIGAGTEVGEVGELFLAPAIAVGELGVGVEAVFALIDCEVRTMTSSFSLSPTVPVSMTARKWAIMVRRISGRWATVRNIFGTLPRSFL